MAIGYASITARKVIHFEDCVTCQYAASSGTDQTGYSIQESPWILCWLRRISNGTLVLVGSRNDIVSDACWGARDILEASVAALACYRRPSIAAADISYIPIFCRYLIFLSATTDIFEFTYTRRGGMKLTGFGWSALPIGCCDLRSVFLGVLGEFTGEEPGLLVAGEPAMPDLLVLTVNSGKKEVSPGTLSPKVFMREIQVAMPNIVQGTINTFEISCYLIY